MCKVDSPLAQILVSSDYLAPKPNTQEQNNKVLLIFARKQRQQTRERFVLETSF